MGHLVYRLHARGSSLSAAPRVLLLVADSFGVGGAPDAADYGDEGSNTLGNTARAVGGLRAPNLGALGLGLLTETPGVVPEARTGTAHGALIERSAGKDTTTGHWELCGVVLEHPFPVYPNGFPREITAPLRTAAGRGLLGNKAASGTAIIEELGPQHVATGDLILYTSADSVLQIAAHEEVVRPPELYGICEAAREIADRNNFGRVIARPFVGTPGGFRRTYNRRDFSLVPPAPTNLYFRSEYWASARKLLPSTLR